MFCYTLCILCIVAGVVLSLVLIWGSVKNETAWRSFMTILVLFVASGLTLSVNKVMERPGASSS